MSFNASRFLIVMIYLIGCLPLSAWLRLQCSIENSRYLLNGGICWLSESLRITAWERTVKLSGINVLGLGGLVVAAIQGTYALPSLSKHCAGTALRASVERVC